MPALFEPAHEASLLRKATSSSWSTDHNLLIHVLAENERTNDQMQELRRAFLKEYKTCPIETVRKATNLPHQAAYNWALLATLLTPDEFAAQCLHLSMAGLGTDERAMTQILAHSTKDEVERIKKTYLRMYSKTLESDIEDDTSGDEREFFLGLINAPRSHVDVAAAQDEIDQDVKELYIAGQRKWSTDVSAFAKIITKHDNEYLAALNMAYGRAYGDTLQRAVEKQISQSVLANGIAAMIMDRADYYASELYWAIQGAGTNTDTLTRIIATQRHAMPAICHRYMTKYGKNLKQHLDQETAVKGTQYGKVLQSLLKVAEATGHKLPTGSGTPQASVEPGPEPNPVPIPQPNPVPIPQPIPQPSPEPKPETKPEPQQPVKLNSSEPGSVVSPMSHMRLGGANPGKSCEAEPTCLNTTATGHGVEIGDDKLSVRYLADGRNSNDVGSVMANEPVPGDRSTFYYEMQVVDPGVLGCIAIGFADAGFKLTRQPGWEPNSYGYHGDDGRKFSSGKFEKYGPTFGAGDIIGAGIHLSQKEIFFTKNGVNLGRAFQNAHGVLYPVIGMHSKNESVRVNFQGPFRFDIDKVDGMSLLTASREGNLEAARLLLDKGADVNMTAESGATPLYMACFDGHLDVVRLLLDRGADMDKAVNDGRTPLLLALHFGHLDVVRLLLDRGASTDIINKNHWSPLYLACHKREKEFLDMVQLLLDKGAPINMANKGGYTPLYVASFDGHLDTVRLLLDRGAAVDKATDVGVTPLYIASQQGHQDIVSLLLDRGAATDKARNTGATPLLIAAEGGQLDVVRLLLERGAMVDKATNSGATPLFIASQNGHPEVVRLLLERGAATDKAKDSGATPLYIASHFGHLEVVRLLLDKGAAAEKATHTGVTPLLIAAEGGRLDVVRLLLERGAMVDKATNSGATPLFIASQFGHLEVVRLLLDKGAAAEKATHSGATPLFMASQIGHLEVVRLLLERGAAMDKAKDSGATPLYIASHSGHLEVVRLLLDKGAAAEKATHDGDTPLGIAKKKGHDDIVQLFNNVRNSLTGQNCA